MTLHNCYRFSGARHRDTAVELSPPFAEPELLPGVGYLPLLLENLVIVSFLDGMVVAYEKGTRAIRWRFRLTSPYETSLPFCGSVMFNGTDLMLGDKNELIILDPNSGAIRAREGLEEINIQNGAPLPGGFIATYRAGKSYQVGRFSSPNWNSPLWTHSVPFAIQPISASRQVCCFLGELGEIVSVDPNSGYERWRLSVKETGAFVDDLGRPRKGEVASDILLWKDLVIFGVRGNHIMAVEGHSGRLHWNVTVDSLTPSNLTLDARGVLHLLTDSRYYRIHAQDGKMISEIDIEAALKEHGLLAICHIDVSTTHVFAGDLYGTLFALDQTNGKVAWKFFFGNRVPFGNYPLVADDRIYHLDGAGELRTF